jgi:hypothetical protein
MLYLNEARNNIAQEACDPLAVLLCVSLCGGMDNCSYGKHERWRRSMRAENDAVAAFSAARADDSET